VSQTMSLVTHTFFFFFFGVNENGMANGIKLEPIIDAVAASSQPQPRGGKPQDGMPPPLESLKLVRGFGHGMHESRRMER